MLLLFWNGIKSGDGSISSLSVLTGDGVRTQVGEGVLTCVSALTGDGGMLHVGYGLIDCLSVLIGIAESISPQATYLITIVNRNGAAYSFTGAGADDPAYTASEAQGVVEYATKRIGRTIP